MKRILILIAFLGLVVGTQAQDRTVTRTLGANYTLYDYSGQAADTIGISQTSMAFVLKLNKNAPVLHNIEVNTDPVASIDGTYTVDIKLQGKVFSSDSWSDIDATNTGVDATTASTIDFASDLASPIDTLATGSNAPFYRFFRVLIENNGTGGLDAGEQMKVDYVYWKMYER